MAAVRDLLARKGGAIVTVSGSTTVLDASTLMVDRGIGGVIVMEDGRLAGIFTERDVLRRVVAMQQVPATSPVHEVMTSPVLTVTPETTLEECRALMTDRRIRHLPVIKDERLVGIVSIGDLVKWKISEVEAEADGLKAYIAAS
jgi:CBS domain-containing protein